MAPHWWWNVPRRTTEPRRKPPDEVLWLVATVSLVLPVVGGGMGLYGLVRLLRGDNEGGWWLAAGAALIILDYVTDIWLHRVSRASCEEPELNARGARHVGRIALLAEPIVAGRGRLKIGDSVWTIEGPDLPAGVRVRITGCRSAVLIVEPL